MATQFDPYLQWLGIRDPQRPPNHYRLLGLELFENDPSVIAMSADRQMAHLRNFKTGPEADLAQRLLNELSAARICLLKADRKAAYDNQLRATLKPAAPARAVPIAAATAAQPTSAPVITTAGPSTKYVRPPAKASWKPWAILASLVLLCVGLTTLLINKNSPADEDSVANSSDNSDNSKAGTKSKPSVPVKSANVTPVKVNPTPETPEKTGAGGDSTNEPSKKGIPPEQEPKAPLKPMPEKASGNNKKPPNKELPTSTNTTVTPNVDPTKLIGEEVDPKAPEKTAGKEEPKEAPNEDPKEETSKKPEPTEVALAPPSEPEKPKRIAVPSKAAITAKEKEVRDIFADEYKSQKPEVKAALAAKLRQSSADSKEDATMRYVLLSEARANAILGGAVSLAVEITEELIRDYDVSEGDERFSLFGKMLAGGNIPAAYYQQVLDELRKATTTLQSNDEYDAALKLVNMAATAARVQRDTGTVTEMAQRVKEISQQKAAYLRAKAAKETLAKNAADPAANESWGSYLSFTKGDFLAGLPFLTRGSSSDLADLAKRELAEKKSQSDQLGLADDWWVYADKVQTQDALRSANIRQHAGEKYVTLFPKLSGIDKAKAEKRIAELKKISDQKGKRDTDQMLSILYKNRWKIDWQQGGDSETLEMRPDGSCVNRVFSLWKIENNQVILMGGNKTGETYHHIGKMNFNFVKFDLEFYQGGRLVNTGIGRPIN